MAASTSSGPLRAELPSIRSQRINVLVADETPMSCQLLGNALSHSRFAIEVVASAVSRAEIFKSLGDTHADVALVGESLKEGQLEGFRALSEIRAAFPATRVIALLKAPTSELVVDAFRAGAKGVVCMTEEFGALCKSIRAVHSGQIWINSQQLNYLVEALVSATPFRATDAKGKLLLAKRETEVANLVAEGLSNRDVARQLGLSEHSVSNYLFRIYEKLGISSRVELVLYVLRHARAGQ
jgi:DNA-binding NarL/FixJ family response regulator